MSNIETYNIEMNWFNTLYKQFNSILEVDDWIINKGYEAEFDKIVGAIGEPFLSHIDREKRVFKIISEKLDLYREEIKKIIDYCASRKIYFNYHEKKEIESYILDHDLISLDNLLNSKGLLKKEITLLLNISFFNTHEVLKSLHTQLEDTKNRINILSSLFSAFLYSVFPVEKIHLYNSGSKKCDTSFYNYLKNEYPAKYDRKHALSILKISNELYHSCGNYDILLSTILIFIKEQYSVLQNYCYLGIIIDHIEEDNLSVMWTLYSDIVLFAEKFREEHLNIGYFHPSKIQSITSEYIKGINPQLANFNIANSGFTYKDCFVIAEQGINSTEKEIISKNRILILFQKNDRDEDIIPCPACRSNNVRGNSYPVLGVKSWECNNIICPDRSKYNRGKRYSLSSVIKQEAIEQKDCEIDKKCINDWRLDVVSAKTDNEILEFLIKHYSFCKDIIHLYNFSNSFSSDWNRILIKDNLNMNVSSNILSFFNSSYFNRYLINNKTKSSLIYKNISPIKTINIMNGNCQDVLKSVPCDFFDAALTSPPYYNAREYSQWDNIYCFLYDIFNQTKEVYRTLKPGAYYIFNIFDYFDNENNVVFSNMGKKRMILGAYIINMFRRIGFILQQNTIWYKGHIQGHRSTNQGNNSPYYQSPLNCYEHIFCFRKPGNHCEKILFPDILNVFPVIKMVKGENILGHTAPFPIDIPNMLTSRLKKGVVLDPYAGSFTTARSAYINKIESYNIEISSEYCQLGIKILRQKETSLFGEE